MMDLGAHKDATIFTVRYDFDTIQNSQSHATVAQVQQVRQISSSSLPILELRIQQQIQKTLQHTRHMQQAQNRHGHMPIQLMQQYEMHREILIRLIELKTTNVTATRAAKLYPIKNTYTVSVF